MKTIREYGGKRLVCYRENPQWTKETVPSAVLNKHRTKVGTWGKITVIQGKLNYTQIRETGDVEHIYQAGDDTVWIEPQEWHKVTLLSDDVVFQVSFYCLLEDYEQKCLGVNDGIEKL